MRCRSRWVGAGGVAVELNDCVIQHRGVPRWRSVTRFRVVAVDEMVVVGSSSVNRSGEGSGVDAPRSDVQRTRSPCADALRERRDESESALRDGRATKARGQVFDRRVRLVSARNGWRSRGGGGRPSTTHPPGRVEARRTRVPRIVRTRANVSEVVTRPRGSLATRSAKARGEPRGGATVALPESAGFPIMIDELRKLSPTKIQVGARD